MDSDKNNTGSHNLFGKGAGGAFAGFNFSASSTTPQSSPAKPATSIFGSTPSAAPGGSIFGNNNKTGSVAQNTLGGTNTNNTNASNTNAGNTPSTNISQPTLNFAPSSNDKPATSTTSIFGSTPSAAPGGSIFGNNNKTGSVAQNTLGGANTNNTNASNTNASNTPSTNNSQPPLNSIPSSNTKPPTSTTSLFGSTSSAAPGGSIFGNSNKTGSVAQNTLGGSLLKGKTLEDLVSRWNSELDERVEDFKLTANEIAAWDQVLIQNGDQISALYEELQRIDPIQSSIDQTLDYVEIQQSELSAAIDDCERQLTSQQAGGVMDMSMMTDGNNRIRTAGQEREEAYKTAEEVHAQLNDMAGSLGTMIAELNSLAGPGNRIDESSITDGSNFGLSSNSNMEDPIVQISGILNAHLGSLNWISEITNELSSKIIELESRISNTKLEFGLESNTTKHPTDLDDFNHLSLNNPYNNHNNHNLNGSEIQGFGAMRNLSSSVLSHPRR